MTTRRDDLRAVPRPEDDTAGGRRIGGLDVARGLAVLGMFGAHLGDTDRLGWAPDTWRALADGRPSILFATLAGVSIALLSGGRTPASGDELPRARTRVLVRAAWVFAIGGVLELLDTFVAIILGVYAVLFVLALPFLRWTPRRLLAAAGLVALAGPPLTLWVGRYATARDEDGNAFAFLLFTGYYPAAVWLAFVLTGLAVGRLDLRAARVRAGLVAGGAAAAAVGYLGGWVSTRQLAPGEELAGIETGFGEAGPWRAAWFAGAEPHSSTTFEVVGSGGVAVAVIGLCLVAADAAPRLLYPLASVGALALSVYSGQIVALRVLAVDSADDWGRWARFTLAAVLLATGWRLLLGRGPLERLLTWSSRRTAGH
ncbi:heparan-alpha-glucosaminide N-acetyltransferase domain-containing protein [Geodermatophilus sp. DSM 44513]|uniref:heparan-alpha-glucosaminide N-acetyltransferase domain-containing protein n=1 Tax=Geodermatophilus sp. DSM 44513 TaxID=1528104 RepID=UPI0012755B64|nr:heparan-alpha-glucosaminide N-acetyltransferase domain-containing protein [Geodermatophilus sp. DSM 44513]WNV77438.1 heparan-alpha-glucosaminide N-acetyltransferase domain-containing protein [Geodermatophilus sp. DSM 44513]